MADNQSRPRRAYQGISLAPQSNPDERTDELQGPARDAKLSRHEFYGKQEAIPVAQATAAFKERKGPSAKTLAQVTDEAPEDVLSRQNRKSGHPDSKRTKGAVRETARNAVTRKLKMTTSALGG